MFATLTYGLLAYCSLMSFLNQLLFLLIKFTQQEITLANRKPNALAI